VNARLGGAGYRVDYLLADSKGNSAESIRGMTEHYLNGTLAFIGPENTCAFEARTCAFVGPENTCAFEARDQNTCAFEARVAAAWNLPMIGFVSTEVFSVSQSLIIVGWWRGTVVERRSLAGELSLSCARPAADG